MPRLFLALAAVVIVPFIVSTAHADPSGKTTPVSYTHLTLPTILRV